MLWPGTGALTKAILVLKKVLDSMQATCRSKCVWNRQQEVAQWCDHQANERQGGDGLVDGKALRAL
jgi:hypothetical protein